MRGAEILVDMLARYDVELVFGLPGDTNVPLYDALRQAQNRIRHVMARDERSAGYMADAYSRISGKPAVVEVPSGAGATYVLPAVAEANGSSVAMVVITSDTQIAFEGQGVITELDCARLFEVVTKGSWQVKSAKKLPEMIRRAFRVATSGRPGATHLAIPEDILNEIVDLDRVSLHVEGECARFPSYRLRPAAGDVDRFIEIVKAAERPLVIAGGGVNRSGAGPLLQAMAERTGLPVVTTITGQSAFSDNHRLAIGVIGDNGFHPHANKAVEEADLLIYLGCRVGSVVTVGWTFPSKGMSRAVVQVDTEPQLLGDNTTNELSVCADIRAFLEELDTRLPAGHLVNAAWPAKLNLWRREFWGKVKPDLEDSSLPLKPPRIVAALNRHLSRSYNIISDPGTPTPYMTRLLRLENESRLIIPRAYGGLGYALPAVIGAWLADPARKPIGLFGDGSFGMAMGELETVLRLKVPALLLHFNNATFGWIKALQRLHNHRTTYSVDFSELDAAKIATAFGMRSWRATTTGELDSALDEAFAYDGPAFVDIIVESIAEIAPPVFSWLRRSGHDPLEIPPTQRVRIHGADVAGH